MENLYSFHSPRKHAKHEVSISVCAGVAEFPEAAGNSLELINCSEIVMFRAKEHGPNSMKYFEPPIFQDFIDNINIENKLKEEIGRAHV